MRLNVEPPCSIRAPPSVPLFPEKVTFPPKYSVLSSACSAVRSFIAKVQLMILRCLKLNAVVTLRLFYLSFVQVLYGL